MKLGYTILYVKDVARSVAFYEDAFGLSRKYVHDAGLYAEMETGATTLAFAAFGLAKSNLPSGFIENSPHQLPAGFEVAFITENLQQDYQRAIESGATPISAPCMKPWGQECAFLRDLDGITIELCTPARHS